jgi:hypothetical protein
MNTTIWKYTLSIDGEVDILMPLRARIISAQAQDGKIAIWAIIDPSSPVGARRLAVHGTGGPGPRIDAAHIGTVQLDGFVWHVFDAGWIAP